MARDFQLSSPSGFEGGQPRLTLGRIVPGILFAVWLAVVGLQAVYHVVWRDEVRALSLALNGGSLIDMVGAVHGEGHPLLWYLLLRGTHELFPVPQVLPGVALAVAVIAALLLAFVSPLPWPVIGLCLAGYAFLFEYSVEARNYGITMMMLFFLAAYYRRGGRNGIVIGLLLVLLANCNVHSDILAGAFLLFWGGDIYLDNGLRCFAQARQWAVATGLTILGMGLCAATVFPTFNDAVVPQWHQELHVWSLAVALVDPAGQSRFGELAGVRLAPNLLHGVGKVIIEGIGSVILYGSTLGLVRRPAAFIAALGSMLMLSLFFTFVYGGSYRHDALWLSFLVALYWMVWEMPQKGKAGEGQGFCVYLSRIGVVFFVVLLGIQAVRGVVNLALAVETGVPRSQSANFATYVKDHVALRDAILIADPDYLLEPMPYYLRNPTYLMRQQVYGNVVKFTTKARLDMSLGDVLAVAETLHKTTGRPVVILLQHGIVANQPEVAYAEGYDWTLSVTPRQASQFLQATILLKHFAPASTNESFDAYLLRS